MAGQHSRVDEQRLVGGHSNRLTQAGLWARSGSKGRRVVDQRRHSRQVELGHEQLREWSGRRDHGVGVQCVLGRLPSPRQVLPLLSAMSFGFASFVDPARTEAPCSAGGGKSAYVANVHDVGSKLPHERPPGGLVAREVERIAELATHLHAGFEPLRTLAHALRFVPRPLAPATEHPVGKSVEQ